MVTIEEGQRGFMQLTDAMLKLPDDQLMAFGKLTLSSVIGHEPSDEELTEFVGRVRKTPRSAWSEIASFPLIEKRSVVEIMRGMRADKLPDGRTQLSLPAERALPPFPPRSQWKPKDVGMMRQRMVEFYESPFGLLSAHEMMCRADIQQFGLAPEIAAPGYTAELHTIWSSPDLLLVAADEAFVDMMEAAAVTAPTGPLQEEELVSERGVLFFLKERFIPSMCPTSPTRGVMWYRSGTQINVQIFIDGHHERDFPGPDGIEPPVGNYSYLYPINVLRTEIANPAVAGDESMDVLGFLRSIAAIARSPQTRADNKIVEHREKKGGRVRNIRKETVRTLSLRNTDYGRYELDAATGRKLRQHWVRGHWRNQWYRGEQINKTIWIDGFVRGDASLGKVTGDKVHVARGPRVQNPSN